MLPGDSKWMGHVCVCNMGCYGRARGFGNVLVRPVFHVEHLGRLQPALMSKAQYQRTYIEQWRKKRGLSLRRLAERLEDSPGGDLMLSHTSIGRIEKGQQPYSQPTLEAIAAALGVPAWMLLEVNPDKDGDVIDITLRLNKAPPELRDQAISILNALLQSSTGRR